MNIIKILYIIIILIGLTESNIYGQVQIDNGNIFSIEQTVLPGLNPKYKYIFQNETLTIQEINQVWKSKQFKKKTKRIYRDKLSISQIQTLDSIIRVIDIVSLDTSYCSPTIDGIYWTFIFQNNGISKKVILDNYYLERLDILLEYINGLLPEKKQLISFDGFRNNEDIRNE